MRCVCAHTTGLYQIETKPYGAVSAARMASASMAAKFRSEESNRIIYRLSVDSVCAVVHQPRRDPAAVIEARKPEGKKGSAPGTLMVSTQYPGITDNACPVASSQATTRSSSESLGELRRELNQTRLQPQCESTTH
jgi:hypothetical protein